MANITLTVTTKINGVPTDVTSVKLSNPIASYGVIRRDTGAVVVADDTAMTSLGSGVYEHTFTEPVSGLDYDYYVEVVYLGTTHWLERQLISGAVIDAGGSYAGRNDIEQIYGVENILKWADLDNDADATKIADRVLWALELSHSRLNDLLRGGPYAIPFTTGTLVHTVVNLQAMLAGVIFYEARGVVDFNAETGVAQHRLHFQKAQVEKDLKIIMAGVKPLYLILIVPLCLLSFIICLSKQPSRFVGRPIKKLVRPADDDWLLIQNNGKEMKGKLLGTSYTSWLLVIVNFKTPNRLASYSVIIFRDALPISDFKRLKGLLKAI